MIIGPAHRILSALILAGLGLAGTAGFSQTLRTTAQKPHSKIDKRWPAYFRYSVTSDYADNRSPRGYTHSLGGSLSYNIDSRWSLGMEAELRAETVKGQIEKGKEESYSEVLNPAVSLELAFSDKIFSDHSYAFFAHGTPLMDEPSRREGYKGIVGGGGSLVLAFLGKRYSVGNTLDVSSLINTFDYGGDGEANPDYFYTYRFDNSLRFWGSNKLTVSFGAKVTRYLDGFTGYAYKTSYTLSHSWSRLTLGASYVSGGFTDEGRVNLWYLDQYRRVATLMANYSF
jgi:hypothetical protein